MNTSLLFRVLYPGLAPFFNSLKETIMQELETLKAKLGELATSNETLAAEVAESNGKTDLLISAALTTNTALLDTTAALKALQEQVANGPTVSPADIQPLIDKTQAILDASVGVLTSITAQDVETDAAVAGLTPQAPV